MRRGFIIIIMIGVHRNLQHPRLSVGPREMIMIGWN